MKQINSQKILTQEQLAAIGCVAVESASLEGLVDYGIYKLTGQHETTGRLLLGNMMLGSKVDVLADLFKLYIGQENFDKDCSKVFSDIKHELSNRNTIIHGFWATFSTVADMMSLNPAAQGARTVATKPMRSGNHRKFEIEKVMDVARAISVLYLKLQDLIVTMRNAMASKHRKDSGA